MLAFEVVNKLVLVVGVKLVLVVLVACFVRNDCSLVSAKVGDLNDGNANGVCGVVTGLPGVWERLNGGDDTGLNEKDDIVCFFVDGEE